MTDFGAKLRRERESRNISLQEISETTKISKRYLEALERNDFDALPGGVFIKGYIRTYAESIGLDPDLLLEDYRNERRARGEEDPAEDAKIAKDAAQAALTQLATSIDRPRPERGWLLPILTGCALLAIAIWAGSRMFTPESEQEPPAEAGQQVTEPKASAASQPSEPPRSSVERDTKAALAIEPVPDAVPAALEQAAAEPEQNQEQEPATVNKPEPADERQPPADLPAVSATLSVTEHGVGSGIADRLLVGESDTFREGDTVWFWTRVVGGVRGDLIRHVWIHEGEEAGAVELNIGGAHWRTQSRRVMQRGAAGRWTVEARDARGRLLARSGFRCLAAD